ncbi:disulfide bond formation protein B [Curvivirga sp.]|uniref:disulfide bond formation protein B n=1 Tax=Curvivirga sp. TaxID=2856848 RepID=UPI003B5CD91C
MLKIELFAARTAAWILLISAVLVLGAAHVFEYGFGYEPCKLCLYQRLPWWLAIGLGSVAINFRRKVHLMVIFTVMGGLALLVGAGIAGYHTGVEYKLWEGPSGCTGTVGSADMSLDELKAAIMSAAPVRCDEIPWSLFGISMAGYNFLLSLGFGLFIIYGAWFNKRKSVIG